MVVMFRSAYSAGPGEGLVGRVQCEAMGRSWPRPRQIEDGWMQYRGTGGDFDNVLFTLFGHIRIYGKATGASSGLVGTVRDVWGLFAVAVHEQLTHVCS